MLFHELRQDFVLLLELLLQRGDLSFFVFFLLLPLGLSKGGIVKSCGWISDSCGVHFDSILEFDSVDHVGDVAVAL